MKDKLIKINLGTIFYILSITILSFLFIFFLLGIILDFSWSWVFLFLLSLGGTIYSWSTLFGHLEISIEIDQLEEEIKELMQDNEHFSETDCLN